MFWVVVFLLFFGIMLILAEVIVPHGISIVAGLLVIAGSIFICYKTYGPGLGTIYMIVSVAFAGIASYFVFRSGISFLALHPPRPEGGAAPAAPAQNGGEERPAPGALLRVSQPLRPTGTVEWRGRRFPARSLRPERESAVGEQVRLCDWDSIYLLVEPEEKES